MAALSVAARTQIFRGIMRLYSNLNTQEPFAATKNELYNPTTDTGLIADMDAWIDAREGATVPNTVGLNNSIAGSYRAKFTVGQKGIVFSCICLVRTGNIELLKRVAGEVD